MSTQIFVEVRAYTWDRDNDPPIEFQRGNIASHSVEFVNAANAASAQEDLANRLREMEKNGLPKMIDRVKPGPKPAAKKQPARRSRR